MIRLFADVMETSLNAGRVVTLRLSKIAKGGPSARRESRLMVEEKLEAAMEAGAAAARQTLAIYRKRVARNLKRLSKR